MIVVTGIQHFIIKKLIQLMYFVWLFPLQFSYLVVSKSDQFQYHLEIAKSIHDIFLESFFFHVYRIHVCIHVFLDTVGNCTESTTVDGINLDEIKEFARQFKIRRLSLGLTQTQVGQALSATEGPAYSQSAICRYVLLYHSFLYTSVYRARLIHKCQYPPQFR